MCVCVWGGMRDLGKSIDYLLILYLSGRAEIGVSMSLCVCVHVTVCVCVHMSLCACACVCT